jgi:hypothetical protein
MSPSKDALRTPERSPPRVEPDTVTRCEYFYHVDHLKDGETMKMIADEHGIEERTGRRWRKERRELGSPIAKRRVRKAKAEILGHTLGRIHSIPQSSLDALVSPSRNPKRRKPLYI